MEKIKLDTGDKCNKLYGLETSHPLVSVVDLTKATRLASRPLKSIIQRNTSFHDCFAEFFQ